MGNNCNVFFSSDGCVIQDQVTEKIIRKTHKSGRLFPIDTKQNIYGLVGSTLIVSPNNDSLSLWHRRSSHLNYICLSFIFEKDLVPNINVSHSLCSICFFK